MKTKVLYIGGSGRSGSTFLSMLLSQNDDMFNVGQIRDLTKSKRRNSSCTCQKKLRDCEYWSQVVAKLTTRRALPKLADGYAAFRKDVLAHKNWNKPGLKKRLRKDHADYLELLGALYAVASDVAGNKMLVDSSKSPELAYAMVLCEDITPYMLNLVRDPRAVVVSWAKRRGDRDGVEDFMRKRAREWRTRQKLLAKFQVLAPERYMLLRYENLTAAPRDTIAQILEWAGQDATTLNFSTDDQATVSWDNLHLCPPINESVFKARSRNISIRLDDGWKDGKNRRAHEITSEVAFPAATKYDYSL